LQNSCDFIRLSERPVETTVLFARVNHDIYMSVGIETDLLAEPVTLRLILASRGAGRSTEFVARDHENEARAAENHKRRKSSEH
jgi:hypothetical protein